MNGSQYIFLIYCSAVTFIGACNNLACECICALCPSSVSHAKKTSAAYQILSEPHASAPAHGSEHMLSPPTCPNMSTYNRLTKCQYDIHIHKQTSGGAVRTAGAQTAHFLPLLPNECHKECEASIFQRPHQARGEISL